MARRRGTLARLGLMSNAPRRDLIAFCHIAKCGGQTVVDVLRRNFGLRHVDCKRRGSGRDAMYTAADLAFDLRVHPGARSLHSHHLRPWVDYGVNDPRLRWYAFVRDPRKRLLSQYQYAREVIGNRHDFRTYVQRQATLNVMVHHLSGSEDLQAAIDLLDRRFAMVGIVEDFKGSLLVMRKALGYPALDVRFARAKNVARSAELRASVEAEMADITHELDERIQLDHALYQHVLTELWPRQVEAYGSARLEADKERVFASAPGPGGSLLRGSAFAYRNTVYAPAVALQRFLTGSRPAGSERVGKSGP